jgi:hypothetical protein
MGVIRWRYCRRRSGVKRVNQIIRELKRQVAGEKLEPEQALSRAGYVYRNGDEHLLTDMGREALAQPSAPPGVAAVTVPLMAAIEAGCWAFAGGQRFLDDEANSKWRD